MYDFLLELEKRSLCAKYKARVQHIVDRSLRKEPKTKAGAPPPIAQGSLPKSSWDHQRNSAKQESTADDPLVRLRSLEEGEAASRGAPSPSTASSSPVAARGIKEKRRDAGGDSRKELPGKEKSEHQKSSGHVEPPLFSSPPKPFGEAFPKSKGNDPLNPFSTSTLEADNALITDLLKTPPEERPQYTLRYQKEVCDSRDLQTQIKTTKELVESGEVRCSFSRRAFFVKNILVVWIVVRFQELTDHSCSTFIDVVHADLICMDHVE